MQTKRSCQLPRFENRNKWAAFWKGEEAVIGGSMLVAVAGKFAMWLTSKS